MPWGILDFWAKKTPPVSGWRSNYAHLTEVNLQPHRHRNVNSLLRASSGPLGRSESVEEVSMVLMPLYLFGSRYIDSVDFETS